MGNGIVKEKNRKIIFDKGCSRIRKICFMPQDSPEKKDTTNFENNEEPPGIRRKSRKKLWN